MNPLEAFARAIPKAELHIHIEGTLEPELMFALAKRNGVELPFASIAEVKQAYQFTDLQSFLDIYYAGAGVLHTEQDFYDLAWEYFERAQNDGVRRAEIFFDPQAHTERGVPFETVITGLHRAASDAASLGVDAELIMCFLRHLGADSAMSTLEAGLTHRHKLLGIGLDSSEVGHPPTRFADVYDRARAAGLHLVAHAGEEGPPEYVTDSLDVLGVERIDHGVRALESPDLVARLATERIPLTVCPMSNVKLRVVATMTDHPLREMLQAGLMVTVNSDDPSYFGGYVGDNFVALIRELGIDRDEVVTLARNSFEAAFIDAKTRTRYLNELDRFIA